MNTKCIGCYDLLREEVELGGRYLIVYNCPHFPYACALSGLLRPGSGIIEAMNDCPERIEDHCILCPKTDLISLGEPPIVFICTEHYHAWSKWLDEHPERQAYLSPKGRARKANWIEVFREFIEDMRKEAEGQP